MHFNPLIEKKHTKFEKNLTNKFKKNNLNLFGCLFLFIINLNINLL